MSGSFKDNGKCDSIDKCYQFSRLITLRKMNYIDLSQGQKARKGTMEDYFHKTCNTPNYASCGIRRGLRR